MGKGMFLFAVAPRRIGMVLRKAMPSCCTLDAGRFLERQCPLLELDGQRELEGVITLRQAVGVMANIGGFGGLESGQCADPNGGAMACRKGNTTDTLPLWISTHSRSTLPTK